MISKKVSLYHPLIKMAFKFYVADDATKEEVMETFEVKAYNYLTLQKIMNNPFAWTDELKQLAKGKRLREISPQAHIDLLSNIK